MLHDTCPHCGYRKAPYIMSTRSDSSLREIMEGKDGQFMANLAKYGLLILGFLFLLGLMLAIRV